MLTNHEVTTLFQFTGALSLLAGVLDWARKGSQAEDDMIVQASNVVLEALSDGDMVERINCIHHRNLRDQVTIEQAIELDEERRLRRWPFRN